MTAAATGTGRVPDSPSASEGGAGTQDGATLREATVYFADAVSYSSITEADPAAARRAIRAMVPWQTAEVRRRGGRVISVAGDGVMAEFPDPAGALATAAALQERAAEAARAGGLAFRFRVGLAHGPVWAELNEDRGDDDLFGPTVILAARLEQIAEPGAVNFTDGVRPAADALGLTVLDLGFRKLKGVDAPQRIWRVALPGDELLAEGAEGVARLVGETAADERRGRSIAVLRFTARGGEDEGWLAEGVAEDVAAGLSRSRWMLVTSPRSSFAVSDAGLGQAEIAARLNVRYLVQGSVRRARDTLRVSVQLIDCDGDMVVWSDRWDRPADDLFAVQDEIASAVTANVEPAFLRHEERLAARVDPRDLRQWDLLMRARWHFWRGGPRHMAAALDTAEKALALGDRDADTHAFLSFVNMTLAWSGQSKDSRAAVGAAIRHASRAVELDETNANARFTLGTALSCLPGRHEDAIREERRALELNPHMAAAMGELGRMLAFSGEGVAARRHLSAAEALSPQDPTMSLFRRSRAISHFLEDDREAAVETQREAVAARPDWFFHHYLLAALLGDAGRTEEARAALARGRELAPRYRSAIMRVGHPFREEEGFARMLAGLKVAGWDDD